MYAGQLGGYCYLAQGALWVVLKKGIVPVNHLLRIIGCVLHQELNLENSFSDKKLLYNRDHLRLRQLVFLITVLLVFATLPPALRPQNQRV